MTFNADEKAGKLTFEPFSNGQALSPLQAALVKGSPYARCGKVPVQHSSEQPPDPTPAAAATPVAWTNLPAMVGKYQGDFDLFGSGAIAAERSEEHTSELPSLLRNSYAVFCMQKHNTRTKPPI